METYGHYISYLDPANLEEKPARIEPLTSMAEEDSAIYVITKSERWYKAGSINSRT